MTGAILIAAGGTGGHVFPALALYEVLRKRGRDVVFATDERGARFLPEDVDRTLLPAAHGGVGPAGRLKALGALAGAYRGARRLIGERGVKAVVGFGGYAAAAAGLAAPRRRLILHEQNAVMGRTNRILARRAHAIALSFEDTRETPEGAARLDVTGVPVRQAVRDLRSAYAGPGEAGPIRLVLIGGSQGAHAIAQLGVEMTAALPERLRTRLDIVQQARPEDLEDTRAAYQACGVKAVVKPFFDDMARRIADAHLVISRAGASSIAETTVLSRPAILIPYPSAADDHQTANAKALAAAGGAALFAEETATGERLAKAVTAMLAEPKALPAMADAAAKWSRPDAGDALADIVLDVAAGAAGAALNGKGAA